MAGVGIAGLLFVSTALVGDLVRGHRSGHRRDRARRRHGGRGRGAARGGAAARRRSAGAGRGPLASDRRYRPLRRTRPQDRSAPSAALDLARGLEDRRREAPSLVAARMRAGRTRDRDGREQHALPDRTRVRSPTRPRARAPRGSAPSQRDADQVAGRHRGRGRRAQARSTVPAEPLVQRQRRADLDDRAELTLGLDARRRRRVGRRRGRRAARSRRWRARGARGPVARAAGAGARGSPSSRARGAGGRARSRARRRGTGSRGARARRSADGRSCG